MNDKERTQAFLNGLTLPAIFSPILEHLLDNGETHVKDVITKIERGHPGGTKRIVSLFGSTEKCIEEAFAHLVSRGLAMPRQSNGTVSINYSYFLMPGMIHKIFTKEEHGVSIEVDLQTAEEREKRFLEDRRRILINDWLHDMQKDNLRAGFRQIYEGVRTKTAIRKNGYRPDSYIIIDDSGHVIDGKRRLIACHELGIEIPPECFKVYIYESNEDKLLHAWHLNNKENITWAKEDEKEDDKKFTEQRLKFLGIDINSEPKCEPLIKPSIVTEDLRRRGTPSRGVRSRGSISRAYLMNNLHTTESDAEIARKLGITHATSVGQERQNLEGLGFLKRKLKKRSIFERLSEVCREFTVEEMEPVINFVALAIKEKKAFLEKLKDPEQLQMFIYGDKEEENGK